MADLQQKPEENGKERKVVRTIQQLFPQPLKDRLSAVLSSINTEWKAITLAAILDVHGSISSRGMQSAFASVVGSSYIPRGHKTFAGYADQTFVPIGLVACKVMMPIGGMPMEINEWCLTDAGEKYGAPVAAFTIDWLDKWNRKYGSSLSMYQIFGQTDSRGNSRSPYNRAALLLKLFDNPVLRQEDLSQTLALETTGVRTHIQTLEGLGFLDYSSVSVETSGWAKHIWNKQKNLAEAIGDPKIGYQRSVLKRRVMKLLASEKRPLDCNEIANLLKYDHLHNVSTILTGLAEKKYTSCQWIGGEKQSEAKITDLGKEFVETYLKPVVNALSDGNALGEMQRLRKEVVADMALLSSAAQLYYPHSQAYKFRTVVERINAVLRMVRSHQEANGIGSRTKDILKKTQFKTGQYIGRAFHEGLLEKKKDGKEVRYTLTEKGRKIIS